jgi:hypothetical protein
MTHPTHLLLPALLAGLVANSMAQTTAPLDPTRPASQWLAALAPLPSADAAPAAVEPLGVQIIVIGAGRRFAVIDGHLVHIGESHLGAKLLAIGPQGVGMKKDGAALEWRLTPEARKQVHPPKVPRRPPAPGNPLLPGEGQ